MTNEERQKFCAELREALPFQKDHEESTWTGELCEKAADEIERLAKRNKALEETAKKQWEFIHRVRESWQLTQTQR